MEQPDTPTPAAIEPDLDQEAKDIHQKYLLYLYDIKEKKEEKKKKKKEQFMEALGQPAKKEEPSDGEFLVTKYNTTIYVTGIPLDADKDEIIDCFKKVGVIKKHPETGDILVKMYEDDKKKFKGEALITFLKRESIALALQVLHDTELRFGCGLKMKIEEAKFKKREGVVDKGPSRKKKKKKHDPTHWGMTDDVEVEHKVQTGTLILHHMFVMEDFTDPDFMERIKAEVTEEAAKFGEVKKVIVYDNNPDGIIAVKFTDRTAAEKCAAVMNGRFYAKRKIEAHMWDGKTNYSMEETAESQAVREKHWKEFLGEEDE